MIKSILVPMSGSDYSREALGKAVKLSQFFDATLNVLHVEDIQKIRYVNLAMAGTQGPTPMPLSDEDMEALSDDLARERETVQGLFEEMKPSMKERGHLFVAKGRVDEEILAAAGGADLVVMGKASVFDEAGDGVLSPTLMNVIRKVNKPLLAVTCGAEPAGAILAGYDGSRSANNALQALGDLHPFLDGAVVLLTVSESRDAALPILAEGAEYLKPYGMPVEQLWRKGKPEEAILAAAAEREASLIVIGGYGDNPFKEFLVGSTTERVLKTTDIPVLVCNG